MSPLARAAWLALAVLASTIAALALLRWAGAVALAGPVLYGEGAVAHAALLARHGGEYAPVDPPSFVAANYTPLYFHLASLGDPFVWGRGLSIVSTLTVAALIVWRARSGGRLVALALGAAWLALAPVAIWGAAVKPDLLALVLTVAAVVALDARGARREERAGLAGALAALAVLAKPTAALPALALALWLVLARRHRSLAWYATAAIVVTAVAVAMTPGGIPALRLHVVDRNALPWMLEQAITVAALGALTIGAHVVAPLAAQAAGRPAVAYLVGALGIVALSGREGATINYLLDASAAGALVLSGASAQLGRRAVVPALLLVQILLGLVVLDPLGADRGTARTGAWGRAERIPAVRALPAGPILAEDAGLVVARGEEPVVDDLFLWSRLAERGAVDREPLLAAIRAGAFVRVVSEVELSSLETAPGYARQRWPAWLAAAVLERYTLERRDGALHIYRPR